MKKLQVGIVGIGGFGHRHLGCLKTMQERDKLELVACCDRNLDTYKGNLEEFDFRNIRSYRDYDEFLESERELDFIVITTPIPLHKDMCLKAMRNGNNILLEKPPAVTIQDVDEMIAANRQTGKVCAVDFQMTSAKSFAAFKNLLSEGKIGEIKRVTGVGLWKRTKAYYTRSPWVGKLIFNGSYVLDGTINNPFSHLLNNCLIAAGCRANTVADPEEVQAELHKANPIEGEDTSCLRIKTKEGPEILFFATTCSMRINEPYIIVEGTKGKALWKYNGGISCWDYKGVLTDEMVIESNSFEDHYENFINCINGENDALSCPLESTRNFVLTTNLAFESSGETHPIDKRHVQFYNQQDELIDAIQDLNDHIYLTGIERIVEKAVADKKLFSEMGLEWAVPTQKVCSDDYKEFKRFK